MRRAALWLTLVITLTPCVSCENGNHRIDPDTPEVATYLKLVMPARINVLSWTKPVSVAGDGRADGIEAILAAYDAFDDVTKIVGTIHFELLTRRVSERIGDRVAFWAVQIDSAKAMRTYLEHPSGFYRFPLELEREPLPAGRYTLSVQLQLPTGKRLLDEYEFEYDGGGAPSLRPM